MMKFRVHTFFTSLLALPVALLLAGCNDTPAPKQTPAGPPPQQQVVSAEPAQPAEQTATVSPPAAVPPVEYAYNPQGRRDPFRSILIVTETAQKIDALPPLQRTEIADMRLIGIVWGGLGYTAMVQMPDGKGYSIRVGTLIGPNNGVVKKITERSIMVEEKFTDIFGEKKKREVVLDLYPQKEGTE
jgi:type IV pilus assembly protein PilP